METGLHQIGRKVPQDFYFGGFPFSDSLAAAVAPTTEDTGTETGEFEGKEEWGKKIPQGFPPLSLSFKSSPFGA